MSNTLLPRLNQIAVDSVLEDSADKLNPESALEFVSQFPDTMSYAASGGSPLQKEELLRMRQLLVEAAKKNGFPDRGTTKDRAQFDTDVTEILGEHPVYAPPEALRDDVWAFLTAVVAPDIVIWRFGKSARERFHGGVRNAFQRLWMRAWSLDRGTDSEDRWGLIRELTEDSFVQIVERPSIGGDPRLARALAEGWVRMSGIAGRGAMEAIMRRAVIAFRLRNQIQMLAALDDAALRISVDAAFERARASLGDATDEASRPGEDASVEPKLKDRQVGLTENQYKRKVLPEKGILSGIRSFITRGRETRTDGSPAIHAQIEEELSGPFRDDMQTESVSENVEVRLGGNTSDSGSGNGAVRPQGLAALGEHDAISEQLDQLFEQVNPKASNYRHEATSIQSKTETDLVEYLTRIEAVAAERKILSPKSKEALANLRSGDLRLSATDRNALENLRKNLSKIGVLFDIPNATTETSNISGNTIHDYQPAVQLDAALVPKISSVDLEPGRDLVWNEIKLPEQTEVSMIYKGERHMARISDGKIVDQDGAFTPSKWARKVAENTSRNAWIDLWFKKPGQSDWVLADAIRKSVRSSERRE